MGGSFEITINGKPYPCRPTMGAMVRFKRESGREISEMTNTLEDLSLYLYCCLVSACNREGKPFDMDFLTFCDNLDIEDMNRFQESLAEAEGDSPKKKAPKGKARG